MTDIIFRIHDHQLYNTIYIYFQFNKSIYPTDKYKREEDDS